MNNTDIRVLVSVDDDSPAEMRKYLVTQTDELDLDAVLQEFDDDGTYFNLRVFQLPRAKQDTTTKSLWPVLFKPCASRQDALQNVLASDGKYSTMFSSLNTIRNQHYVSVWTPAVKSWLLDMDWFESNSTKLKFRHRKMGNLLEECNLAGTARQSEGCVQIYQHAYQDFIYMGLILKPSAN